MAQVPNLDNAPINLKSLRDQSQKELITILKNIRGKKCLVIDPKLGGSLSLIVQSSLLKEHGAELRHLNAEPVQTDCTKVVYLVRAQLDLMKFICSHIHNDISKGIEREYFVRRAVVCEKILEEEKIHHLLTIGEYPLYLIPLDEDVLSFELDAAYEFSHTTSDEEHLVFKKMHAFSTVDGFVEVTESLIEMIKFIANEPSAGLFYVQQHTHTAVPNLINLTSKVEEKSRQVTFHRADPEDSMVMVRSMKECGFSIANEMIKDLRHSLAVVSEKQLRSGFIRRPSSSFRIGRTISWSPSTWGRKTGQEQDGERNADSISNVFRSAKEKASSFKWPQMDSIESKPTKNDEPSVTCSNDATLAADASSCNRGQQR